MYDVYNTKKKPLTHTHYHQLPAHTQMESVWHFRFCIVWSLLNVGIYYISSERKFSPPNYIHAYHVTKSTTAYLFAVQTFSPLFLCCILSFICIVVLCIPDGIQREHLFTAYTVTKFLIRVLCGSEFAAIRLCVYFPRARH